MLTITENKERTKFFQLKLIYGLIGQIPWQITGIILSAISLWSQNNLAIFLTALFWIVIGFTILFKSVSNYWKLSRKLKILILTIFYGFLFAFVSSNPAFAQDAASCSTVGLFAPLYSFVDGLFGAIDFGSGTGGFANLICSIVALLTIGVVISFLGVLAYASYQVGVNNQPISQAIQPLYGVIIFIGGASFIIAAIIGTSSTTTTTTP